MKNKQIIRLTESDLHKLIKEAVKEVLNESPRKKQEWGDDEFVSYDEYANYGISGRERERNWSMSEKNNVPLDDRCPFCDKQLKQGSYRTIYVRDDDGISSYYNTPNCGGEPIKVGNGCFRRLQQAYNNKYRK